VVEDQAGSWVSCGDTSALNFCSGFRASAKASLAGANHCLGSRRGKECGRSPRASARWKRLSAGSISPALTLQPAREAIEVEVGACEARGPRRAGGGGLEGDPVVPGPARRGAHRWGHGIGRSLPANGTGETGVDVAGNGDPPLKPEPRGSLGRSRSPLGAPKAFRPAHPLRSAPEGRPPLEPFGSGSFPSTRAAARTPAQRRSGGSRGPPGRPPFGSDPPVPPPLVLASWGEGGGNVCGRDGGRQASRLVGFRVPRRVFARCPLPPR
jgi:hypothetical protein